jgi:hypothetical protein
MSVAGYYHHCAYDDEQLECFGTPEHVESVFVRFFGPTVSDDYVRNLQTFLSDIHAAMVYAKETDAHLADYFTSVRYVRCEVAIVDIFFRANCVQLESIVVRPCAERLGILKLVFWQLAKSCDFLGWGLIIDYPLPKTKIFLKRLGSIVFNDEGRKWSFIASANMPWITQGLLNVRAHTLLPSSIAHELTLSPLAFPPAHILNSNINRRRGLVVAGSSSSRDRADWQKILRARPPPPSSLCPARY